MWVTDRKPWAGEPGLQVDIMVDDAEETVAAIVAHGGEIVQPIGWQAPEITAVFRDPAGNLLGIYQEPPRSRSGRKSPGTRGRGSGPAGVSYLRIPAPDAARLAELLPGRVRLGHPR